jgi:hypothetical protein
MAGYANYRKYNDRSLNSSTYHKKDGTSVRTHLKNEVRAAVRDALDPAEPEPVGEPCPHCGGATRLIKTPRRCNREHSFCPNCPQTVLTTIFKVLP